MNEFVGFALRDEQVVTELFWSAGICAEKLKP
jgi:hypothetical protein